MLMETIAIFIALLISLSLLVVASQCFVALVIKQPVVRETSSAWDKVYNVLIPAHDEAAIIEKTLRRLLQELPDANPKKIVLIADNCTDNTAEIAKSLGVNVIERHNAIDKGKGFALDFGVQYLKSTTPPDIVVILDADCETSKADLNHLIELSASRNLPAQMIYLMRVVDNASIKQKIAGFAWLLKNKIRLLGMNALGLPVVLTGTGMAFPWGALEKVHLGSGNLVEDMQLGIDCALNGYPPLLCPNATVYSDFPEQSSAEHSQRTRWEHGHLQTICQQVPVLVKGAWCKKNIKLLLYAFDIGVPPLSLLVMVALGGLVMLAAVALITASTLALTLLGISFTGFAFMLIAVWWRFGQDYLSPKELRGIPFYIVSKLSIYTAFVSKRQRKWVRTERDS